MTSPIGTTKTKLKENVWRTTATILQPDGTISPTALEQRWIVLQNRFCTELRILKGIPSESGATSACRPTIKPGGPKAHLKAP
ncbi:unnamed protein product [Ceutorhynchus assimilis]|uniref:Uncharacterized protein n=1 Tax=Ceutorhynchus assimilis TaxID=467358 RepID=A0A9P0GRD7_9CUCU|nr:unnamed protein product [Ceutorhynchus assimilis]